MKNYRSHFLTGIRTIDNIIVNDVEPPQTKNNPFENVYMRTVTIDITYEDFSYYQETENWELIHAGGNCAPGLIKQKIHDPF